MFQPSGKRKYKKKNGPMQQSHQHLFNYSLNVCQIIDSDD